MSDAALFMFRTTALTIIFFVVSTGITPCLRAATSEPLSDEALLDLVQRKSFQYFLQEANPKNGLIPDHASNFVSGASKTSSSIAAVGFALTAYGVGVHRGWIEKAAAQERTRRTLAFFLEKAQHEHGFFYHFLNMDTGQRAMRCEVSPIDTALFLAGAFFA